MALRIHSNPFGPTTSAQPSKYSVGLKSGGGFFDIQTSPQKKQERFSTGEIDKNTLLIWWMILFFGLLILTLRALFLQTFSSGNLSAIAEGNRVRIQEIKANRGVIYDRHGTELVKNIPHFSLAVVPVDLPDKKDRNSLITELSQIANTSTEALTEIIDSQPFYSYRPVIIKDNLDFDQAIIAEIKSRQYPGVVLKIDSSRSYLETDTSSFAHVLGYPGKLNDTDLKDLLENGYSYDDKIGKAGVELIYEDVLRGQKGRQQVEVDATGNAKEVLAHQDPIAGNNLVLTIDAELQKKSEESLRGVLDQYGKTRGSVIAMDPNSGEILAFVSWPSYDNNIFSTGISQTDFTKLITDEDKPLFNRSISGEYPSGSTFKMIVAAAALEENLITSSTGFSSVGGVRVSSWFFPDWKAGGHGWTTVGKALAESVNTFFYIIGGGYNDFVGLGVARIKDYSQKFGLNQKLGIDLPNEKAGFIPSKDWKEEALNERWYIGDTYNLSIGQGNLLVTPLQVAAYTSVFANGGTLYQPHLVKEVIDPKSGEIQAVKPKVIYDNIVSKEVINAVNYGMRQTVLVGSARQFQSLPISVVAKTGTAQWSSKKDPHAWITTFAPYENPQIVITVLIEEGDSGSSVAQPVAVDILRWFAQNR